MFSPYHRLENCRRLQLTFDSLRKQSRIPEHIVNGHNKYHYALLYKLRCAQHWVDSLESILSSGASASIASEASTDTRGFLDKVNMAIDGFFYFAGSSLDILAREVLTYFNIPLPHYVYYQTAREQLSHARPGDPMLTVLSGPPGKQEFSDYRNALTHEIIIGDRFSIDVYMIEGNEMRKIVYPLADDPRLDHSIRTHRRNPDVLVYCTTTFGRLLRKVNQIHGSLESRMRYNSQLPI